MTDSREFFHSMTVGKEIPSLVKAISLRQLVMYSATTWDFNAGHYDRAFAQAQGFKDAYLDGPMNAAFLAQMITDWIGLHGSLKKLNVTYRNMVFPGDRLTGTGNATKKYVAEDTGIIECELSLTNQEGKTVATGSAEVALPL